MDTNSLLPMSTGELPDTPWIQRPLPLPCSKTTLRVHPSLKLLRLQNVLETQVLLQHMPTDGGRRRALGQCKVRDLPAGLPSSLFPLLVSSSPLHPKAKFACLGNRAAANLSKDHREDQTLTSSRPALRAPGTERSGIRR